MGTVSLWADHWFTILQSVGIVAGLIFTGLAARANSKALRVQLLVNLTEQHRSLWMCSFESPRLLRVLEEGLDLEKVPPTAEEKIFLNLIFLQLTTVLESVREGVIPEPDNMDLDLRELLRLPLPIAVWNETLKFRDIDTKKHVEQLLGDIGDHKKTEKFFEE